MGLGKSEMFGVFLCFFYLLPSFPSFFLFLFLSCGKKKGGGWEYLNLVFSLLSEEGPDPLLW